MNPIKTMALLTLVLAASGAAMADDWWNASWQYRQQVEINASDLNEDLVNFPLTLRITDTEFIRAHAKTDGADLRIVLNGETLPFELTRWDAEVIELHVKLPKISAKTPGQCVGLYYGNASAQAEPKGAPWDENYRFVLHLAGNLSDSTGKSDAVTTQGDIQLGPYAKFSKASGYLNVRSDLLQGLGEQISIIVRFKSSGEGEMQTIASGKRTDGREEWFNFAYRLEDIIHTNATSNKKQEPELNVTGATRNAWHSAAVVYDARNHTRSICIDGIKFEQDSALTGGLAIQEMRIGRGLLHFDGWQFDGELDEVRLEDSARSESWIRAEASCLSDINTFYVITPPQEYGKPASPPTQFALISPQDGFQCRQRDGELLKWAPSAGAKSYSVRVFVEKDDATPLVTFEVGNQTNFKLRAESAMGRTAYWTVQAKSETGEAVATEKRALSFYDWNESENSAPEAKAYPEMSTASEATFDLHGYLRKRIDKCIDRYFLTTPESSPAILQVFRDRDKTPVRDPLMPWAGEFAGKYLTGGELTWRLTHNSELRKTLDAFAQDLIATQGPDGYLGPFPKSSRLTGANWDVWGHYHCILGLLLYYEDTEYEPALDACKKAADLLFETFGPGGPTLTCDGSGGQMNMAICHAMTLLYDKTGADRYLELAKYVVETAWNEQNAGHYLEAALAGKPMYEFPQHRWEALHDYQALPELYWITGADDFKRGYEQMWRTGVAGDRHNTGGVTAGEGFVGSPYNQGPIETCCTVAWLAFSLDMLRMTEDSRVTDEIEWSTLNSALGAIPYSGRVCAYNVPMDGTRTFGVELPWQSPKAGPDLNCCAVNAYRPLGMISQWALMSDSDSLVINYYGPGTTSARLTSDFRVTLVQETEYPTDGHVKISVVPDKPETFTLKLRIPVWSASTTLKLNGFEVNQPAPGQYYSLSKEWKKGDIIEIDFDFSLRYWLGEKECANKLSVYRGPLLLAYDARYSDLDPDKLPTLDWASAKFEATKFEGPIEPWMLGSITDKNGVAIPVCDLSSAGQTGNHYRTWLPAGDVSSLPEELLKSTDGIAGRTFRWPQ